MQEVCAEGLTNIISKLEQSPQVLRAVRGTVLSEAGEKLLETVRERIGGSGAMQSRQAVYLGSGKGYVAVRPKAKDYIVSADGKRYATGAVTNALESGHTQSPGQFVPAIGAKLRRSHVPGKYMYQRSAADAEHLAQEAADRISKEIARKLEE